jgi:hypothetical protein
MLHQHCIGGDKVGVIEGGCWACPFVNQQVVKQGVYAGRANAGAIGPVVELFRG